MVVALAGRDEFVHALEVIEVGTEVIQEDRLEEDAAYLGERWRGQRRALTVPALALAEFDVGEGVGSCRAAYPMAKRRRAPSRIAGLSGVTWRRLPSPKYRSPGDRTRTGGKGIGIDEEASTCSTEIFAGRHTRRLFVQIGCPARPE